MSLTTWLPLQNAAGALRDECSSLETMVQELFADLDRLSAELEAKADELEEGRRHLAERGRQLAEQRKESARLSHQLEQQETQLSEALSELRDLRAELANRPEPTPAPDLSAEFEGLRSLFARQLAEHQEQIQTFRSGPSAAVELDSVKEQLLQQHEAQLQTALAELREMRADFAARADAALLESSKNAALLQQTSELQVEKAVLLERLEAAAKQVPGDAAAIPQVSVISEDSLQALAEQFADQLAGLKQQIQTSQPGPSTGDLEELKKSLLEQHGAQLASALAELRELRAELAARADVQPEQDYESAALRQQVTELEIERAMLRQRLEAAEQQSTPGDALALSQEKVDSLSDQFTQQFIALQGQIQSLQQNQPEIAELEALKAERLELEAELELVRARSAALQETVALQKRDLASQRVSVSEELQELRALLAEQTRMLSQREPSLPAVPAPIEQPRAEKESSPELLLDDTCSKHLDPVVNSVMAQFAKLQKDISQRRKKK